MSSPGKQSIDLQELIALLDDDRALLLEKIDKGCWPELRHDLAALERELGHFLAASINQIEN